MKLPVISLKDYCLLPVPGAEHVWTAIRRSDGAKRLFTPDEFLAWYTSKH